MLLGALAPDSGPEIVLVPMLLIGLGIGALASQLGAITVSAVPDEESPEVGGVQNTMTNLGASLGTALAGSVMIAAVASSFLAGIEQSPAIPERVKSQAQVELAGGVPFVSDADLEAALDEARVGPRTTEAALDAYRTCPHRGPPGGARDPRGARRRRALLRAAHPDEAARRSGRP